MEHILPEFIEFNKGNDKVVIIRTSLIGSIDLEIRQQIPEIRIIVSHRNYTDFIYGNYDSKEEASQEYVNIKRKLSPYWKFKG